MGGSQLQTALDRGDYGTQSEAVGRQAEEVRRQPEVDKDLRGNPTATLAIENEDKRYILSRRAKVIASVAEFAPDIAARLRRMAEVELGEPMGGEPPMDLEGGADLNGAPPTDPAVAAPAPATSPNSDVVQNLQEIARQRAEDVENTERQLASQKETLKDIQDVLSGATVGPDPEGKEARRDRLTQRRPRVASDMDSPEIKPGNGVIPTDNFSEIDRRYPDPKYKGGGDANDAYARQMREADDKPREVSVPGHGTFQDAGDYPLTASRNGARRPSIAQREIDWNAYDRNAPGGQMPNGRQRAARVNADSMLCPGCDEMLFEGANFCPNCGTKVHADEDLHIEDLPQTPHAPAQMPLAASRKPTAAPVKGTASTQKTSTKKTAEADELQPHGPTGMHGTYDAADQGDQKNGDEIDAGNQPTLESGIGNTPEVAADANREMDARSRESQKGSVTGAVAQGAVAAPIEAPPAGTPIFAASEVEKLKVECARIVGAFDAIKARSEKAKVLVRADKVVAALQARLGSLKQCADAVESGAVATKGDRTKVREAMKSVLRQGRREVEAAQREATFLDAALVEAAVAQDREGRIGPAFSLACNQVKAHLLSVDELPAKVAEYVAMDRRTFEIVAKTVAEVSNKAAARANAVRPKTAGRIPSVNEDPLAAGRQRDEIDDIFG